MVRGGTVEPVVDAAPLSCTRIDDDDSHTHFSDGAAAAAAPRSGCPCPPLAFRRTQVSLTLLHATDDGRQIRWPLPQKNSMPIAP